MKSVGNSGMDAQIYCEKTNPPLYHTGADLLIGHTVLENRPDIS